MKFDIFKYFLDFLISVVFGFLLGLIFIGLGILLGGILCQLY